MQVTRKTNLLSDPYAHITVLARKQIVYITKILRNHEVIYSWGYPTKLIIIKEGVSYMISTVTEALCLAKKCFFLPTDEQAQPHLLKHIHQLKNLPLADRMHEAVLMSLSV